ncbi:MAG: hypothetical protein QW763_06880 [Archaeoglobaceae archaeon]
MGKINFSFSLIEGKDDDLITLLREEQKKGLNLSQLVRTLLRHYFFGSENDKTMTRIRSEFEKIKKEYEEMKLKFEEYAKTIEVFESRFAEERKKTVEKMDKEELEIIEKIRKEYTDRVKQLIAKDNEEELNRVLDRWIAIIAKENKLSLPKAKELFDKTIDIEALKKERLKEVLKTLFYDLDRLDEKQIIEKLQRFANNRKIDFSIAKQLFNEVFPGRI